MNLPTGKKERQVIGIFRDRTGDIIRKDVGKPGSGAAVLEGGRGGRGEKGVRSGHAGLSYCRNPARGGLISGQQGRTRKASKKY